MDQVDTWEVLLGLVDELILDHLVAGLLWELNLLAERLCSGAAHDIFGVKALVRLVE